MAYFDLWSMEWDRENGIDDFDSCIWSHESLLIKEKVIGSPKDISLRGIFRNFLLEKKNVIDFFNNFLYFP